LGLGEREHRTAGLLEAREGELPAEGVAHEFAAAAPELAVGR